MDTLRALLARADPNQDCTPSTCDASQSIYGYRASLAASLIFLIIFALSGVVYTWQGVKTKTWFFSIAMMLGCFCEVLGYVAKIMLWNNPFSDPGFKMSIVTLTIAPAFFAAGIYYTLKHIALTFGSSFSRLRPAWYTWIFISFDLLSIILQGIGGGVSSAANDDTTLATGKNVMVAGLAFQVFTLVCFGVLVADYALAVRRNRTHLNPETEVLRNSQRFKLFLVALTIAYIAILIRCSYRVAELAGGWSRNNKILRDQGLFIGLDSTMCAIATIVLNVWHPGWCFPKHQQDTAHKEALASGSSSDDEAKVGMHA